MRINVNLSDDLNSKVEYYSKQFGVSKSQFCSMIIGQGILSYDKSFDLVDGLKDVVQKQIIDAVETVNKNK